MHRWWGIFWVAVLAFAPAVAVAASTSANYQLDGVEWSGSTVGNQGTSSQFEVAPAGGTTTGSAAQSSAQAAEPAPTNPATPTSPTTASNDARTAAPMVAQPAQTPTAAVTNLREVIRPVVQAPVFQVSAVTANITTVLATVVTLVAPPLANSPLLNRLGQGIAWLLSLGAARRRTDRWGTVLDAESGQPIPLALVRVLRTSDGKLMASSLTDHRGRFSIVASAGSYVLEASKAQYRFPSTLASTGYRSETITLKSSEVISATIMLDPDIRRVSRQLWQLGRLTRLSQTIQVIVLALGSGFAVVYALAEPTSLHRATLIAYAILFVSLVVSRLRHPQTMSRVVDRMTNAGLQLAIVRLFTTATNRLVSTVVSDQHGYLTVTLAPGSYRATATHPQFARFTSEPWEESGRSAALRRTFGLEPLTAAHPTVRPLPVAESTAPIKRQILAGGIIVERGPNFAGSKS